MKMKRVLLTGILLFSLSPSMAAFSETVLLRFPEQKNFFIELPERTRVSDMTRKIEEVSGMPRENLLIVSDGRTLHPHEKVTTYEGQEFWIDFLSSEFIEEQLVPKKTHVGYRKYHVSVTEDEKKDIHFILKTLAQKSLASLWGYKSQLEYAGSRIDHIHPLRFLECVFTDDELIVYIYNIKKRGGWVWSEFIKGYKESLQDEMNIGNMKDDYLQDFTRKIGIEFTDIYPLVLSYRWEELVKTLIDLVPRDGNTGRYDQ